jgi:hypothetical protein
MAQVSGFMTISVVAAAAPAAATPDSTYGCVVDSVKVSVWL